MFTVNEGIWKESLDLKKSSSSSDSGSKRCLLFQIVVCFPLAREIVRSFKYKSLARIVSSLKQEIKFLFLEYSNLKLQQVPLKEW